MRRDIRRFFDIALLLLASAVILFLYAHPVPARAVLAPGDTWYESTMSRSEITDIQITSIKRGMFHRADEAWDASAEKDGSVHAYRDGTHLTLVIEVQDKLILSENASRTFAGFSNVSEIRGLWKVDAAEVRDFSQFFYDCLTLAQIHGAQEWNTGNGENFEQMLENCTSLESVDLRAWDMTSAVNLDRFFAGCRKLHTIRMETWGCTKSSNDHFLYETGYDASGAIYVGSHAMAKWVDRTDTLEEGGDKGIFFVINVLR